jgi:hypothetical protein
VENNMGVELHDTKQIIDNTKVLVELRAAVAALKETVVELIIKGCSTQEEKNEMTEFFDKTFINNLNKIRGVDVHTNLNLGKVILTKYNKTETARRWEINADTKSTSETAN